MKSPAFLIAVLGLAVGPAAAGQVDLPEIVSLSRTASTAAKLRTLELDFLGSREGRLFVAARPRDLARLEAEGIPFRFETPHLRSSAAGPGSPGGPIGAYHTGLHLERDLFDLSSKHPGLAKLVILGESLERRPIYGLKISDNVALEEDEAEVLILGCHHAREWISVEVPFLFAKFLLESYGTDPEVTRLVDQSEVWIVPLVNPDGHDYSVRVYRYWRKNRRDNGSGVYGVDLNRNYGYKWGVDNLGSSGEPSSEVFRGTAAFSEPETRAVRDLFLKRDFRAVVSYHSFSQVILYPWGHTTAPAPEEPLLRELALRMSELMRPVNGRTYAAGQGIAMLNYLTNGDTVDWTYATAGVPSYTIELPPVDQLGGGFFNAEKDIEGIFLENVPALLYLLQWAVDDYAARPPSLPFGLLDLLRPRLPFPRR